MFLFESLRLFRTTEPKIFNILRLWSAIIFTFLLVFYAWNLLDSFVSNIYKPTLFMAENSFEEFAYPEFRICPGTLRDNDNDDSLNMSLYKLYRNNTGQLFIPEDYSINDDSEHTVDELQPYNFNTSYELYSNNSISKHSEYFIRDDNDNRCRIFKNENLFIRSVFTKEDSLKQHPLSNELLFIITFDNSPIYDFFDVGFQSVTIDEVVPTWFGTEIINTKTYPMTSNQHFVTRGQYVIYEFIVIEKRSYSSSLPGIFGFKADDVKIWIDVEKKDLAPIPNATYSVLELKSKSTFIRYKEEKFQYTVISVISNLGGFYGAICGIFVLLFGASKLSPWGICQTSLLCCWPYRQSFKRHLASRYVSRAGIPLADDPRKLPPDARIEDRVAVLEQLLKEYYINADYLEKLRTTRKRYLNLQNQFHDHEKLIDDDLDV